MGGGALGVGGGALGGQFQTWLSALEPSAPSPGERPGVQSQPQAREASRAFQGTAPGSRLSLVSHLTRDAPAGAAGEQVLCELRLPCFLAGSHAVTLRFTA